MLEITNGVIKFTKGDSVAFDVELKNADGTIYEMGAGDEINFSVKNDVSDTAYVLRAITSSTHIYLEPSFTNDLKPGKYCYDIELNTADGNVYTIIGVKNEWERNLIVYPEVTVANG